jgi:hypothetical protein
VLECVGDVAETFHDQNLQLHVQCLGHALHLWPLDGNAILRPEDSDSGDSRYGLLEQDQLFPG